MFSWFKNKEKKEWFEIDNMSYRCSDIKHVAINDELISLHYYNGEIESISIFKYNIKQIENALTILGLSHRISELDEVRIF